MPLNLWKLSGKPTSFNPLPLGNNTCSVPLYNDYQITFKAKSPSNAVLRVHSYNNKNDLLVDIPLTNNFVTYSYSWRESDGGQLFFVDQNNKGDIIIDSIELVQKPLPKLTVNGIDGFMSGKWAKNSNPVTFIDNETCLLNATGNDQYAFLNLQDIVQGAVYTYSCELSNGAVIEVFPRDASNAILAFHQNKTSPFTFTVPLGTKTIELRVSNRNNGAGQFTFKKPMLNIGSTALPYEPKKGEKMWLKRAPKRTLKAKTGLAFNGITDYLQLPSMTMDSIEIECLIDSVQPSSNPCILDARTGLTSSWVSKVDGIGSDWSELAIDNQVVTKSFGSIPYDRRVKIRFTAKRVFTDDVNILSNYNGALRTKSILYKVTCYLNGQIVAQYDFENPKNIVGNQVIPNAQNLIPGFDDARWNLHANAKVFGKDVLRLDATAGTQNNDVFIPIVGGQTYNLNFTTQTGVLYVDSTDGNKTQITRHLNGVSGKQFNVTISINATYLRVVLSSAIAGSFDFIKPQLYQLSGKEATLYGGPIPQQKSAKRQLFTKR